MDAKLMVATDPGDVKKLKDVLNQEDAVAMVVVTAASKKPSEEDQPPAGNIINPLLLVTARVGSWVGLKILLEREDAKKPPMMILTQEYLELEKRGIEIAQGRDAVSIARDVEEGADHQPAASLAAGALLMGVTPQGDTALHVVASTNGEGQEFLIYAGIIYKRDKSLLFATNHKGDTPLHCAARAGKPQMVSYLIHLAARDGADTMLRLLRMENKRHETALHEAIRVEKGRILGHKERTLLYPAQPAEEKNKRVEQKRKEGVPNEEGQRRVHMNNADGAPEENIIVKLLMGADPELANYPADGISPLYLAILLEKSTIALTLYDMSDGNLSYSGADGQNALHVAVLRDRDTVMVEYLLNWDKSLTTQVDKDGSTPLHFASSVFFWMGSYLHIERLRVRPWCRFLWCPWRSTRTLEKVLEANRLALYQTDKNGSFPIHVAASIGALGAIRYFHVIYPNIVGLSDAKGRTFLHVAVENERLQIVLYACQTPGLAWILNMQDNEGNTALHLAIQSRSFTMFCALFGNLEVNLNLTNNHGETPLDLSRGELPRAMSYGLNPENRIHSALWSVGANHGAFRWDKAEEVYRQGVKPEKDAEMLKQATQTLIIVSVLIATVAFSASFAFPGGYRADDHKNGGTPTLSGSYAFDTFIMATTLAFICSTVATGGFAVAAMPMINLNTRKVNCSLSVFCLSSSVTCMSIAFALGVYMVLAPVARSTTVAVCLITPAVFLSKNVETIIKLAILARPLCTRKGLFSGMTELLKMHTLMLIVALWPFVVAFGWPALARIHHNR
ncbi:hypothetical protein CFC21_073140 [Triticum aestivum]|uniref:PGG domain-containing protein n=3 Tax=Triticum TaxID=4564 RepID=A0A9R0XFD2_TRITD|nr:protein ACCELERATED CELL DEATH 6-like [Triticum aestivum]KAF7067225.1 hypothetical protein CFC21_073140 [Triticum aestivum]VAI35615.1 unnamed protein product [Triticum turgidum subsp. durum]